MNGIKYGTKSLLLLAASAMAATLSPSLLAQSTPIAATPPMGWNSWNHFANKVDDRTIRATADIMVSSGMRDAGYVYVNIDDTWEAGRDAKGNILTNEKFPDMKALADYVHSKGLKLGIYSSPGAKTCAKFEGSLGHEEQDAATYAAWGIDYLKYDLCGYRTVMEAKLGTDFRQKGDPAASTAMQEEVYEKMHKALLKTGRPIVFSLCQYGWGAVWRWGAQVGGNLWRTTGDISDNYNSMTQIGFEQAGLSRFAGPGHWNDPDMLEVGNGGMNADEYRTHMSLWALLAAPLLAGNDLEKMTDETKSILMNREVIAIDQDKLGKQGDRVYAEGHLEVWAKPLADGGKAVGIFNRNNIPLPLNVEMKTLGLQNNATLHDIWRNKSVSASGGAYSAIVPPHGVILLRAK